jgi:hypothetical protein
LVIVDPGCGRLGGGGIGNLIAGCFIVTDLVWGVGRNQVTRQIPAVGRLGKKLMAALVIIVRADKVQAKGFQDVIADAAGVLRSAGAHGEIK